MSVKLVSCLRTFRKKYTYVDNEICNCSKLYTAAVQPCMVAKMAESHVCYVCCVCHKFGAPRFEPVLRHIGSMHSWDPGFQLTCGVNGCPKVYTSYRCFHKHILSDHFDLVADVPHFVEDLEDTNETEYVDDHLADEADTETLSGQCRVRNSQLLVPTRSAALFLLKAKEQYKIPQSALDGLVNDF